MHTLKILALDFLRIGCAVGGFLYLMLWLPVFFTLFLCLFLEEVLDLTARVCCFLLDRGTRGCWLFDRVADWLEKRRKLK